MENKQQKPVFHSQYGVHAEDLIRLSMGGHLTIPLSSLLLKQNKLPDNIFYCLVIAILNGGTEKNLIFFDLLDRIDKFFCRHRRLIGVNQAVRHCMFCFQRNGHKIRMNISIHRLGN